MPKRKRQFELVNDHRHALPALDGQSQDWVDCDTINAFYIESAMVDALNSGDRESLIYWLCFNDRNGIYSDEDCRAEGQRPLTEDEARMVLAAMLVRDNVVRPIN